MHTIDKVLINKLGFTTTTHDRCIYKRGSGDNEILLLRQVDDISIATRSKQVAEALTQSIGLHVKFPQEDEIPIKFLGLTTEFNGVDIHQYRDSICISSKSYIKRLLITHGWDTEEKHPSRKAASPLPTDAIKIMFSNIGPREGTDEHSALEDEMGFNYRNVLGELMYAYITA